MISKINKFSTGTFALCLALFLVACNCSPTLRYLSVSPSSITVITAGNGGDLVSGKRVGSLQGSSKAKPAIASTTDISGASCNSYQFASTGYFSNGTTKDFTSSAVWNSSKTSVATVSSTGLATAVGPGVTAISDSSGTIVASPANMYVDALNFITVTPANQDVAAGATVDYAATGNFTYSDGSTGTQDITSLVTWASGNGEVATITSAGVATAVGQGTSQISAALCGVTGTTNLTVGPVGIVGLKVSPTPYTISVGQSLLFTAVELKSDGTTQPPMHPITWSGTSQVSVDPTSGIAFGVAAGGGTVTAMETTTSYTGNAAVQVVTGTARFDYIAAYDATINTTSTGGIFGDQINSSNPSPVLTPLTPVKTSTNPQQVILHPGGRFLYYVDITSTVRVFYTDPVTGAIFDPELPTVLAGSGNFNTGTTDPYGRFLYIVDDTTNALYGFTINQADGTLTAIPTVTNYTTNLNFPGWVLTDKAGKYLYVVNTDGNNIAQFSIDQTTGAITPLTPATVPTGMSPQFGTRTAGNFIYVAISLASSQGASGFKIDPATGLLTSVGPDLLTEATALFNVTTDPAGKFLYLLDSNSNPSSLGNVQAISLDPTTGAFGSTFLGVYPTGHSPTGIAIDPTGKFMLIDNYVDSDFSGFIVNADGTLTPTTPPTYPTGSSPEFVTFYTATPPAL